MGLRVWRLLLAAALACAVVVGGGHPDGAQRVAGAGHGGQAAVAAQHGAADEAVVLPGAVEILVASRPLNPSETGTTSPAGLHGLAALTLALLAGTGVSVRPPVARRGSVRRRGPPLLLVPRA